MRPGALLFCVQTWVADQWITLDGAEALPREEAQTRGAEECQIVGQERVQVVPTAKRSIR